MPRPSKLPPLPNTPGVRPSSVPISRYPKLVPIRPIEAEMAEYTGNKWVEGIDKPFKYPQWTGPEYPPTTDPLSGYVSLLEDLRVSAQKRKKILRDAGADADPRALDMISTQLDELEYNADFDAKALRHFIESSRVGGEVDPEALKGRLKFALGDRAKPEDSAGLDMWLKAYVSKNMGDEFYNRVVETGDFKKEESDLPSVIRDLPPSHVMRREYEQDPERAEIIDMLRLSQGRAAIYNTEANKPFRAPQLEPVPESPSALDKFSRGMIHAWDPVLKPLFGGYEEGGPRSVTDVLWFGDKPEDVRSGLKAVLGPEAVTRILEMGELPGLSDLTEEVGLGRQVLPKKIVPGLGSAMKEVLAPATWLGLAKPAEFAVLARSALGGAPGAFGALTRGGMAKQSVKEALAWGAMAGGGKVGAEVLRQGSLVPKVRHSPSLMQEIAFYSKHPEARPPHMVEALSKHGVNTSLLEVGESKSAADLLADRIAKVERAAETEAKLTGRRFVRLKKEKIYSEVKNADGSVTITEVGTREIPIYEAVQREGITGYRSEAILDLNGNKIGERTIPIWEKVGSPPELVPITGKPQYKKGEVRTARGTGGYVSTPGGVPGERVRYDLRFGPVKPEEPTHLWPWEEEPVRLGSLMDADEMELARGIWEKMPENQRLLPVEEIAARIMVAKDRLQRQLATSTVKDFSSLVSQIHSERTLTSAISVLETMPGSNKTKLDLIQRRLRVLGGATKAPPFAPVAKEAVEGAITPSQLLERSQGLEETLQRLGLPWAGTEQRARAAKDFEYLLHMKGTPKVPAIRLGPRGRVESDIETLQRMGLGVWDTESLAGYVVRARNSEERLSILSQVMHTDTLMELAGRLSTQKLPPEVMDDVFMVYKSLKRKTAAPTPMYGSIFPITPEMIDRGVVWLADHFKKMGPAMRASIIATLKKTRSFDVVLEAARLGGHKLHQMIIDEIKTLRNKLAPVFTKADELGYKVYDDIPSLGGVEGGPGTDWRSHFNQEAGWVMEDGRYISVRRDEGWYHPGGAVGDPPTHSWVAAQLDPPPVLKSRGPDSPGQYADDYWKQQGRIRINGAGSYSFDSAAPGAIERLEDAIIRGGMGVDKKTRFFIDDLSRTYTASMGYTFEKFDSVRYSLSALFRQTRAYTPYHSGLPPELFKLAGKELKNVYEKLVPSLRSGFEYFKHSFASALGPDVQQKLSNIAKVFRGAGRGLVNTLMKSETARNFRSINRFDEDVVNWLREELLGAPNLLRTQTTEMFIGARAHWSPEAKNLATRYADLMQTGRGVEAATLDAPKYVTEHVGKVLDFSKRLNAELEQLGGISKAVLNEYSDGMVSAFYRHPEKPVGRYNILPDITLRYDGYWVKTSAEQSFWNKRMPPEIKAKLKEPHNFYGGGRARATFQDEGGKIHYAKGPAGFKFKEKKDYEDFLRWVESDEQTAGKLLEHGPPLTPEQQDVLGRIWDYTLTAEESIFQQMNQINRLRAMETMSKKPKWVRFSEAEAEATWGPKSLGMWGQLPHQPSKYGKLQGAYVHQDIREALDTVDYLASTQGWQGTIREIRNTWGFIQVAGDPVMRTHFRQVIGNSFWSMNTGCSILAPWNWEYYFGERGWYQHMKQNSSLHRLGRNMNMSNVSLLEADIGQSGLKMMDQLKFGDVKTFKEFLVWMRENKAARWYGTRYSFMDNFFRGPTWMKNLEREGVNLASLETLLKANKDPRKMPIQYLEEVAPEIAGKVRRATSETQMSWFNYSEVGLSTRRLANMPFGNKFFRYSAEVAKATLHIARTHPMRLVPYAMLGTGSIWLATLAFGLSPAEAEELRERIGTAALYLGRGANGHPNVAAMDYAMPGMDLLMDVAGFLPLVQNGRDFFKGEYEGGVLSDLVDIGTNFLGGPEFDLGSTLMGFDSYRRRFIQDPLTDRDLSKADKLLDMLLPPSLKERARSRFISFVKHGKTPQGYDEDIGTFLADSVFSVVINRSDPERTMSILSSIRDKDMKQNIYKATFDLARRMRAGMLSKEEYNQEILRIQEGLKRITEGGTTQRMRLEQNLVR